jgi:predicted ATPase
LETRLDVAGAVRDALAHLDDPRRLRRNPLAGLTAAELGPPRSSGPPPLQRSLVAAIEALRPGPTVAEESRAWRAYRVLALRYVEGMAIADVQRRLALSRSEYYREHQRALEALVALLRERWNLPPEAANAQDEAVGAPPRSLTPLIGRERDLAAIERLRDTTRLLTLTGPPGTGKTRLAAEVAARGPGAARWVDLATVPAGDPTLVARRIAAALGVREAPGRSLVWSIHEHVGARELLLVLDNFEHVVAAAPLVVELLAACPSLRVLATSRTPLRVRGEQEYPVPPLALPPTTDARPEALGGAAAVALFVLYATRARPDFALTAENACAVAAICQRLDGLPLAIELAASRVKILPPEALLARLSQRLRLLTGGGPDLPARQQTLHDAIGWSYDLLTPAEQRLFARVGVFVGGAALDAAEEVCVEQADDDVLGGIASLVDKSLLRAPAVAGEPRVGMLETIREFALERLAGSGDEPAVRRRHAEHFVALAERAEPGVRADAQGEWMVRLETEHDNLRAALGWCVEQREQRLGLRLAGGLWWFWYVQGHLTDGRRWLDRLLALADAPQSDPVVAWALFAAGQFAVWQGDNAAGRRLAEASAARWRALGDPGGLAWALHALAHAQGEQVRERALLAEAVATFRRAGDQPWGLAWSLHCLGNVTDLLDDPTAARAMHEESIRLFRASGNDWGLNLGLAGLANVAARAGDWVTAYGLQGEALAVRRRAGARFVGDTLVALGRAALALGDLDRAAEHLRAGLAACRDQGFRFDASFGLAALAGVAARRERGADAARLFGAAAALLARAGGQLGPTDAGERAREVAAARAALGPTTFEAEWLSGEAMTFEDAITDALACEEAPPPAGRRPGADER